MSRLKIFPDFGIYYIENVGKDVLFFYSDLKIYQIAHLEQDLYSSTVNILFDKKEYCMTLDFNEDRLLQLLDFSENKLYKEIIRSKLKKNLKKVTNLKFSDFVISVDFEAIPDNIYSNDNESYLTFKVLTFSNSSIVKKEFLTIIPKEITHVIMNQDNPNGFAVETIFKKKKDNDENTFECTACYAGMGDLCGSGSMYLYDNLEEAKNSLAWQILGGFNYAVPIEKLNEEQLELSEQLWLNYKDDFINGFGNRNISLE